MCSVALSYMHYYNCRCQDYVTIDAGAGGSMEYCGDVVPPNPFIVGAGI